MTVTLKQKIKKKLLRKVYFCLYPEVFVVFAYLVAPFLTRFFLVSGRISASL